MYDIDKIRHDFPILDTEVYGHKLVYLDNAATTQKPRCVVDAIEQEYFTSNANVHRGVHYLSEKATDLLENARDTVRRFIGAAKTSEIIFTRGTTESINLVASSYGQLLKEGDEILVSEMEHHSDIVPWQLLRDRCGIVIKVIPITDEGELRLDALERLFTPRTRLVCVTQVSNVLGTINPVKEIAAMAHAHGALCLVDGAQSVPHMPVNVKELGCDFFAFSGHKVYGPTGIGVLWGREDLLDRMPPYQAGGEMIASVTFDKTTFEELPFKFEAGTPNYIGSHALAVALDYVSHIGMDAVQSYEADLTRYAMETLGAIDGIRIFGTAPHKDAVVSFLVANIHHLDMGTLLDRLGIAVRTGHHCAQPLMERLGVEGTVRASLALYNTRAEIDALAQAIDRVRQMF